MGNEERDYACKLFYYFSFASSCKHEIHFIQGKLPGRPAVIKNTIETYLAGEPVLCYVRINLLLLFRLFRG